MSDRTDFESRIAAALQRRADGAPMAVDASAVTRAAATARPSMGVRLFGIPSWRTARLVLAVVLLALLVGVSLVIGSRLVSPAPDLGLGRLIPDGQMTTARGGPTTTLLADGRVLLVGGDDAEVPTAELYDPATGSFTRTGSLSTQRFGMAGALLHDGHVLVVGGTDMMDSEDVTKWPIAFGETFDPATGAFSRTGPMVQARQYLRSALTLPDGRVVIIGGSVPDAPSGATGSEGSKLIATVELYDPAAGVFRPGGSLLVGRDNEASVLLQDGRVLVTGGWGPDGPIASAEIYDPSTGTSEPIADMTTPRAYHSAVLLADGRVLIAGGNGPGADSPALDSVEIFDPAKRTFAAAGRLITERSGVNTVVLDDGRVLVAGGNNKDGDPRTVEAFNPDSGTSSVVGRIEPGEDRGNSYAVSATLLRDGSVLLTGGNGVNVERFDPALTIETAERHPEAVAPVGFTPVGGAGALRTGHTATRLADGRVLIAGGIDGGTSPVLASAEIFDPATGAVTATGAMAGPRTDHVAALLPDGRVLIAGGRSEDGGTGLRGSEIYDPATGTFSPAAHMAAADVTTSYIGVAGERRAFAIPLEDGRVLVIGADGMPADGYGSTDIMPWTAQLYDPAHDSFTLIATRRDQLPGPLSATLLQDGRVLVVVKEGFTSANGELFDPSGDTWTPAGTMASGRVFAAAVGLSDGRVLFTGGAPDGHGDDVATAQVWDPVTLSFTDVGPMGAARSGHTATLLPGGQVLVVGGHAYRQSTSDTTTGPGTTAEAWDPRSALFAPAGTMAVPRDGHTATLLDDGRVLVIGGVKRSPDRSDATPAFAELYEGVDAPLP
jgi:hypothetical protein